MLYVSPQWLGSKHFCRLGWLTETQVLQVVAVKDVFYDLLHLSVGLTFLSAYTGLEDFFFFSAYRQPSTHFVPALSVRVLQEFHCIRSLLQTLRTLTHMSSLGMQRTGTSVCNRLLIICLHFHFC
jgi:hypothetical protein